MSNTSIASTTAAATGAADITVATGDSIQVWTYPPLGAGEKVTVHRVTGGSPEHEARVKEGGRPTGLGSGVENILLTGPAVFRLKKTVTATATTVYYDS